MTISGLTLAAPPLPTNLILLKRRYFATPFQGAVSLFCLALLAFLIWKLLDWALLSAVFGTAGGADACRAASGDDRHVAA